MQIATYSEKVPDDDRFISNENHLCIVSEVYVKIFSDNDISLARNYVRGITELIGFSVRKQAQIFVAVSELLRNLIKYAGHGIIIIRDVLTTSKRGISITVFDNGPGIPDVNKAIQEGFSTSNSLGLGLPACRKLMDSFEIITSAGSGTTVNVIKWS